MTDESWRREQDDRAALERRASDFVLLVRELDAQRHAGMRPSAEEPVYPCDVASVSAEVERLRRQSIEAIQELRWGRSHEAVLYLLAIDSRDPEAETLVRALQAVVARHFGNLCTASTTLRFLACELSRLDGARFLSQR